MSRRQSWRLARFLLAPLFTLALGILADHAVQGRLAATLTQAAGRAELYLLRFRLAGHERALRHLRQRRAELHGWAGLLDPQSRQIPEELAAQDALFAQRAAWHEKTARQLRRQLLDRILEQGEAPDLTPPAPLPARESETPPEPAASLPDADHGPPPTHPKAILARYFAAIQAGDRRRVAALLVPEAQSRVTAEVVRRGQARFTGLRFEDLEACLVLELTGDRCVVRAHSGREVTTLARQGGAWWLESPCFE